MPAIKPIDTKAYGRRFRSRLEARWAVFFTHMGMKWEYEPEGFEVDGQPYLPDFRVWTPQGERIWYEVKPAYVKSDAKFDAFETALNQIPDAWFRTKLLSGDPLEVFQSHHVCPRCGLWLKHDRLTLFSPETLGLLCEPCDLETPQGGGNPFESNGVSGCIWTPSKGWVELERSEWERHVSLVRLAIEAAMSARFEHGKAPCM